MKKLLIVLLALPLLFSCGENTEGCISGDCENGQGTFTWADGTKYVGEWNDGKRNGQGTETWADGDKYVGEYKDDKQDGQGTYTWTNGDKYVGEFNDGLMHGEGTYTYSDGTIEKGLWENDEFLDPATTTVEPELSIENNSKEYTEVTFSEAEAFMQNRCIATNQTLMEKKYVNFDGSKFFLFLSVAENGYVCVSSVSAIPPLEVYAVDCGPLEKKLGQWNAVNESDYELNGEAMKIYHLK